MNNYKQVVFRYLKLNKRRSITTIIGVIIASMVLFIFLNLSWSYVLFEREQIRKDTDYEIILYSVTKSQLKEMTEDIRIKSVSVGEYHDLSEEEKVYSQAVFINTSNPYRLTNIFQELCEDYQTEGEMNTALAYTYMQGYEGNFIYIFALLSLLISFVFAIFGVGIVRNSIQLSTLEQIKDYGNLRCIGATKGQLKSIIYLEGAVLEIIGMIFGIIIGTICTGIIGMVMGIKAGFHLLPVVFIVVAFLGDLYFVMGESCKVVSNMTPLSAIRGEYRIRKEKIKVRKQSIFGKIWGIEGDYAYKSIMRNPGRFFKTVGAVGIGCGAFVATMGIVGSLNGALREAKKEFGYYQIYYENVMDVEETKDIVKSTLPSAKTLEKLKELEEVEAAKRMYSATVAVADIDKLFAMYNQEYLTQTVEGRVIIKKTGEEAYSKNTITCYGYDEEDYARFQSALVEGTLDISENGIILLNYGTAMKYESEALVDERIEARFTDYQIGDTIDIVNMIKYRELVKEELEKIDAWYEKEEKKLPQSTEEEGNSGYSKEKLELLGSYSEKRTKAVYDIWKKLIADGDYKTYTIEGIVNEDVNRGNSAYELSFILPLENYYALTATDESMISGMQYHIKKYPKTNEFRQAQCEVDDAAGDAAINSYCEVSGYIELMDIVKSVKYVIIGAVLFIAFVVGLNLLNIINSTASNLHLRRKEFAQLRVIGISSKQLTKMVLLEGIITSICANILAIPIGVISSYQCYKSLMVLFDLNYYVQLIPILVGIIATTAFLCLTIYIPLRKTKRDMVSDLATGGD